MKVYVPFTEASIIQIVVFGVNIGKKHKWGVLAKSSIKVSHCLLTCI